MEPQPKLTGLGKLVIFLFILACVGGAYYFFTQNRPFSSKLKPGDTAMRPAPSSPDSRSGQPVQIGIAYGTEKEKWFKWAAEQFANSPKGKGIKVNLIPMGSLEGAQAVLAQDNRIHVWSPASALYKDVFLNEWQTKFSGKGILKEEALSLTPMVFVMWKERYEAFERKYSQLDFDAVSKALLERGGWDSIAQKPEWGLFKFGHAHPNQSNSGLMTLVLAAYDFHKKTKGLDLKDILNVDFQNWLQTMERGASGLSNSTGNMMREMILKGPSSFDALLVYENVAIDYLKNAEGRWGPLHVAYPSKNMWNDNPYYILDVPWSSAAHREAAEAFLEFLMTEPIQKEALAHGFRPGNPSVPIKVAGSPFESLAPYGVRVDLGSICEAPKAEVINNLLASWQRNQGSR
jgi:Ca-activated chloride channel family protein